MIRVAYVLISVIAIVYLAGCTETAYQDYPDHWPAVDKEQPNGCVSIAGVYHAVSMTDEVACKQVDRRNWKFTLRRSHESCIFLPDAMLSWDNNLPATELDTDQILIEQGQDSITVYYATQTKSRVQMSLQRDEDYTCDGEAIWLSSDDKDKGGSGESDPVHNSRSFYRGKDGSLIFQERAWYLRTLPLPPYMVKRLTRVWARWPRVSDAVSDELMRIKAPLLEHAREAAERGDMDAAYRLVEDYLGFGDKELRALSLELFVDYPELKRAALGTFSIKSLEETLSAHGDRAKAIEQARLEAYLTIATEQEYQQASENFEKVFPN